MSRTLEAGDLRNDQCYKLLHMTDNKTKSDYIITNYRNNECKDPFHRGPFSEDMAVYNGLGVSNGYVGGCNILADDDVTRPLIHSKPEDKLQERVTQDRYMIPLPGPQGPVYNIQENGLCSFEIPSNQCGFLTSTTVSSNPQMGYNPVMDRYGINSRNYGRKDDNYYKTAKITDFEKYLGPHGRYTK